MSNKWFGKKRVDSSELAEMLSDALDSAFKQHLPDPQEITDAIAKGIVEAQGAATAKTQELVSSIEKQAEAMKELAASQRDQIDEFKKASENLTEQLSKINNAAQDINEILKVQEAVDGLVKQISAVDQFGGLMDKVASTLEETKKYLAIVSQPKTVRLVESEVE